MKVAPREDQQDPSFDDPMPAPPEHCELLKGSVSSAELRARAETLLFAEPRMGSAGEAAPEHAELDVDALLQDPQAAQGVAAFVLDWLGLSGTRRSSSDEFALSAGRSSEMTARRVFEQGSPVSDLYASRDTFADELLATHYGIDPASAWEWVTLPEERGAGLLTSADWLLTYPHLIARGYAISSHLLCDRIPPTPPGVGKSIVQSDRSVSNREWWDETVASPTCAACHKLFNPIGTSFEHFDEQGNYRETDVGLPVDASGALFNPPATLTDHHDLVAALRGSHADVVSRCALKTALNYATKNSGAGLGDQLSQACLQQAAADLGRFDEISLGRWFSGLISHPVFAQPTRE